MNYKVLALGLLGLAGVIVISVWYIDEQREELTHSLEIQIVEGRATLASLALQTDRNEADDVVRSIVVDCTEREEFESLLTRLNSLRSFELARAKQLFELCGDFFSLRKSFMVSRLELEFSVFSKYVDIYKEVAHDDTFTNVVDAWNEITTLEKNKSRLLSEQVDIQSDIINKLIAGQPSTSEDIAKSLSRAQEIAQSLEVTDKRVDQARKEEAENWSSHFK